MTCKELFSMPLAPLTPEQIQTVSSSHLGNLMRIMNEGHKALYIYMTGSFELIEDDDNRTYEETDEDGDPTDPDDPGYFAASGYIVIDFGDRTEEFGINFDVEKLLEIAQPLHRQSKLASYVQRRKA